jgi:hypothetical protein
MVNEASHSKTLLIIHEFTNSPINYFFSSASLPLCVSALKNLFSYFNS